MTVAAFSDPGLAGTQPGTHLPAISMAFQPIVDSKARSVFSYEALVRGVHGESAAQVLGAVPPECLTVFDEQCRMVALRTAAGLGLQTRLHLNLMPQSIQSGTDCLASTQHVAELLGIPPHCLVIEVTEREVVGHQESFRQLCDVYRGSGMHVVLDDFGAGFSGLNLLADFQPDALKLDGSFARGIVRSGPRQAIVRAILQVCRDLGIDFVAEGIETPDEFKWFRDEGVHLFQGYLFGRPAFEQLPEPVFPV